MSRTKVRRRISTWIRVSNVRVIGGEDLLETLQNDSELMANARAKEGISEMALLFKLLKAYKVMDKVCTIDLSDRILADMISLTRSRLTFRWLVAWIITPG